jgi:hypothetical protein
MKKLLILAILMATPLQAGTLAPPQVGDLAPASCRYGSTIGTCTCAYYYFKGRKTLLNCHWTAIFKVDDADNLVSP